MCCDLLTKPWHILTSSQTVANDNELSILIEMYVGEQQEKQGCHSQSIMFVFIVTILTHSFP